MNSGGDQLARGATRAQFTTARVSQEEWDKIFGDAKKKIPGLTEEQFREAYEAELRLQQKAAEAEIPIGEVKIRALLDRIIVRRVEVETKTTTGLYLADESKEKPYEGIVVAVGPGKYADGGFQQPTVKVGERVLFGKFSGAEVKVGLEVLLVLREEDLFLVKE